ncbi:MAG: SPOR domain-containing protein [Bacillota bacterium]|nr:SPOR domain-containing protein [Bacillota bacterium]MDD3298148.1 SPOR domain-containing protein [Bacillota bacterium]MDD4708308.1 SPOR domain-containing protein [Bacillota bacterium]
MRKKRKDTSGKTAKGKAILLLFVVIPLLGIALGYGISKTLLIPYLTENQSEPTETASGEDTPEDKQLPETIKDPEETEPGQTDQEESEAINAYRPVFDVEGLQLYRIQVGAFSKEENALILAEELSDKGLAASMDKEGIIKVYTHYFFSREEAEAALGKVRAHYSDAHISQASFPSAEFDFPDSLSQEAGLLKDQMGECRKMLIKITSEDGAGNNIEGIVKEQKDRIAQFEAQISRAEWPAELEEYRNNMTNLYTAMLGSYSEYNHQYAIPGQISMELINCYVEFLKRLNPII